MPDGFLMIEAVTTDGATVRGLRANEDTFSIQIRTTKGEYVSFRKSSLKELRRLKESPMPSYEHSLASELDDLIAYLAGLRGKP